MKFCVIVIYSFVLPATTMTVTASPSSKASKTSKTNCKSSKSKSGKSDSNKGCTESMFIQHAVPETVGENVFESASIEGVPNLFQPDGMSLGLGAGTTAPPPTVGGTLTGTTAPPATIAPTVGGTLVGMMSMSLPDLGGGTAALPIGEMSMSMPDLGGGTAALTIGEMSKALPDLGGGTAALPIGEMSMSMPDLGGGTAALRINSDTDTMTEDDEDDENDEENGEGFIENIKNATDAGIEFLQNATYKVVDLVNGGDGTETDKEEGVEDDTASAGAVAADNRVSFILCQITAAVASLIVMVIVV